MNEQTQILDTLEQGDPQAASQLPYNERRRLDAQKLAGEAPKLNLKSVFNEALDWPVKSSRYKLRGR
jgi:hypothetical protein